METTPAVQQQKNRLVGGLRVRGREKQGSTARPLVSVITIVRNGEREIRRTIESVLQQSYAPIEYIVIDGNSRDSTVSILGEYDEKIDYWQSEPDTGISDAFNKGIQAARGEVAGIINCGDRYDPGAVQQVVEAFLENPEVGVVCGVLQFWKGADRAYLCHSAPHLLEREMTVTHPTCFVRLELYRRFGSYSTDYRLAMDYEFLLRLKTQGVVFLALDAVLAHMQHDGASEADWKSALKETHAARVALLGNSFFAGRSYLLFLIAKRRLRIGLDRLGLDRFIRFYRSRLALVKKYKA